MKKILSTVAALAALMLVPTVVQATTTTTIHADGIPIDVGPAGCIPGDLVITGNGVLHTTINNALDSWTTGTIEGSVVNFPSTGYTGHAVAWFGVENNNQNFVTHFIANSVGLSPMELRSAFTKRASSPSMPRGCQWLLA